MGGEHRAYQPVYVLGDEAAAHAKSVMEATLAHFPTLRVDVDPVLESEVPRDATATPTRPTSAWIDPDLLAEGDSKEP